MKTKLLTFIAFISLFASPAYAMTTPLLILNPISNQAINVTRITGIVSSGGISAANTFGNAIQSPVPVSGTFSKLVFSVPTTLTTDTYSIHLLKNGISTPINCTIAVGSNSCTDSVDKLLVQPGDGMSIIINTGSDTETSYYAGITFDGTTEGESMLLGGAGVLPTTASTLWSPLGYARNASVTELPTESLFPTSGTLDNFYVKLSGSPNGSGNSWTFTVDKNGTPTSLSCTTNNTDISCNDTNPADAITVAQGDLLDVSVTAAGAPRSSVSAGTSLRFRPTINGESVMVGTSNTGLSVSSNAYIYTGGQSSNILTEALAYAIAPTAFTWEKETVNFDTAPGAGKSRLQLARDNSTDTTLTCLLSGAGSGPGITTCNDNTDFASVAAGDFIDWNSRPTGSPTASVNIRQAAVMFIQPIAAFVSPSALLSPSKFRVYGGFLQIKGGKVTFK